MYVQIKIPVSSLLYLISDLFFLILKNEKHCLKKIKLESSDLEN
jgi:hypothetical protein